MNAMVRAIWRRIVLGACWSEEHGSHRGTPLLLALLGFGAIAGAEHGLRGAAFGAGMMLAGMGPLWAYGCYTSGTEIEALRRRKAREKRMTES